ncbi:MAG: 4-hydroxythreonine-4-phosphate dehydrogenase PdxA [Hyphomicrobium sp.]|nr:4-hydroxythreonine-4-phosphate dehydrogenase PdxA [Hyphomicrobium sp.]
MCGGDERPLPPLAMTMGDPAGIGPEIAVKAWLARDIRRLHPFAVYGDPNVLALAAAFVGTAAAIRVIDRVEATAEAFTTALPVISVGSAPGIMPGRPDPAAAPLVVGAIDRAVGDVVTGQAAAVVTCPIAKSVLYAAGFTHPGHTEYLAHLAQRLEPGFHGAPVMMLAGAGLRVVPLTIHVPLSEVPRRMTADLIESTARTLDHALRTDFGIARPRIAVAGLNPHAGENGTIGREDRDVIAPTLAKLAAEGLDITGPFPADTMFHAAARARYDAALCMYHDQALIPLKTLAFDSGANITLGLPFVRTSPDHGTAFDIAGRGTASAESLIAALEMATLMATRRAMAQVASSI